MIFQAHTCAFVGHVLPTPPGKPVSTIKGVVDVSQGHKCTCPALCTVLCGVSTSTHDSQVQVRSNSPNSKMKHFRVCDVGPGASTSLTLSDLQMLSWRTSKFSVLSDRL